MELDKDALPPLRTSEDQPTAIPYPWRQSWLVMVQGEGFAEPTLAMELGVPQEDTMLLVANLDRVLEQEFLADSDREE